jgi:hypothetical protein
MKRRTALQLGLTGLAGLLTSAWARRGSALVPLQPTRRFLFVVNRGGWDPLNVLTPLFGQPQIAMPVLAEPATIAGLPLVVSQSRPSVTRFFEQWGARSLVLHGLSVRSVSHEVCEFTMMTGQASGDGTDHATRLAQLGESAALPHLVLSGPSYPGTLSSLVARSGATGQLQELISGDVQRRSDQLTPGLSAPATRIVNDFVARRTRAARDARPGPRRAALDAALSRSDRLQDLRYDVSFSSDGSLGSQLDIALALLSRGLAHCVTVSPPAFWDTHTDSDNQQGPLWESLFASLNGFFEKAAATPAQSPDGAPSGRTVLDDTVVVVLSEMARTPQLNADLGRDHWPWTSALVVGDGVTGGRVVGGYDQGYRGLDTKRPATTPAQLGATLLALAGMDPGAFGPGVEPLLGVLR